MTSLWYTGLFVVLLPASAGAQSLADRVHGAPDGTVRLSFAARRSLAAANG